MKKVLLCAGLYLMCSFTGKVVTAGEHVSGEEMRVEAYISGIYQQIDFSGVDRLPYEVFDKAYRGYLNLKSSGLLKGDVLTVCDLELASTENRMWVIDMGKKKVLYNTYVAHGQGSGDDYATSFSNKPNTHKSSLGFYVTGDTYNGEHGTSLRLNGMDTGYNDAAFERGIVVHGSGYVNDRIIDAKKRLGRSWGCPAVSTKLSQPIIKTIKEGTCLFIYYPEKNYFSNSSWLNKKPANIRFDAFEGELPGFTDTRPKGKTIQYISNGRVDSVKTISVQ